MKTIVIDGGMMFTREAAHDYLALRLGFPDYYGRNLDALYDLLSEFAQPTRLVIYRHWELDAALGTYGAALLETMADAARDNPKLTLFFDGEDE